VFGLLLVGVALMSGFFALVLYARGHIVIAETMQGYPPGPELDAAIAQIKASAFDLKLIPAVLIVFTKVSVIAAVTLMISSFSTSWIFTVMVSTMIFIIGHVQPIAREYWLSQAPIGVHPSPLLKLFLGFRCRGLSRFPDVNIVDEIAVGNPSRHQCSSSRWNGVRVRVYFHTDWLYLLFQPRAVRPASCPSSFSLSSASFGCRSKRVSRNGNVNFITTVQS
jgi:hypothetical protein